MKFIPFLLLALSFNTFAAKQWLVCDGVEAVCKTRVKTAYNLGWLDRIEKFTKLRKCEKAKRTCNKAIDEAIGDLER